MVKVDLSGAHDFFDQSGPDYAAAASAHRTLCDGSGAGSEFSGWLELPHRIKNGELKAILSAADKIRNHSDVLVVIGIGGSYLGARAAVELLSSPNYNLKEKNTPDIYFVGNGLSPDALAETIQLIGDRDFSINVISKSGTTLESALAFRVFKELIVKKYGASGARKRIFVTTDRSRGVLKKIADAEGYETFEIPDDVGGRYSVLSAVGLLPMAVAGIDILRVVHSAIEEFHGLDLRSPENPAWQYAAARQHLYRQGKDIEILTCYDPSFRYMAEWWKQLFGESEGKNGIGIFPASTEFTADLHSMGQYIQDGPRRLMETVVNFQNFNTEYKIPFELGDADGLNYLAGRDFGAVCRTVAQAVKSAHIAGGVPNITVEVPSKNEEGFAALVCFFELACAISGYISGVNPFDQPGVEAYKSSMFKLLGRPEK
ncbi:MAG: glucose-6-phosphate isomerase [Oscillospiraceae bacterium]|jgi:glucose-6-phosphate isomerase